MKKLAVGILVLLLSWLTIPPAPAATSTSWRLLGMSPNWISENRQVDFTLEVESDVAISEVQVEIAMSKVPLLGRSEITQTLRQASPASFELVKTTKLAAIAGVSTWQIALPIKAIATLETGIYPISITAIFPNQSREIQVLLPILRDQNQVQPLSTTLLWEISAAPVSISDSKFLNSELAAQFNPESPLTAAINAIAGRAGISVLLDPATVVDASRLAAGGSYVDGKNFDSATSEAAQTWLNSLQTQLQGQDFYFLPYANADLNGLWFKNQTVLADAATQVLDLDIANLPLALGTAVVPARGDFSTGVWQKHSSELPELRVLSSKRYESTDSTFTPSGVVETLAGTNALVFDKSMSDALTLALTANKGAIARQALLADSLMMALERPNDSRVLVLKPNPLKATVDYAAARSALDALVVPWISPVTAAESLATTATTDRSRTSDRLLPVFKQQTLQNLWSLNTIERAYSPVISGSVHGSQLWAAMARTVSINHPNLSTESKFAVAAYNFAQNIRKSIRIVSVGSVAFAGESGLVPVTIENDFSMPVSIKIESIGVPSVRVVPQALDVITIEPGRRKSIEIPTTLRGSDVAYLEVQVLSLSDSELGDPVRIQLTSSAYSKIASYVVYGAFGMLLLLIANNTVKRIRKSRVHS